jgi:hypothetical protein
MATIAIGVDPTSGNYICKVPVNSLAEDGTPPEEGDTVQYSVEGTVQSISGPTATVKIDSINGEPVSEEASESPEEEGAEPEPGTPPGGGGAGGGGAGGGKTPVAANGPASPGLGLGRAKIGGTLPGETLAGMGARLRKGARGRPMPF